MKTVLPTVEQGVRVVLLVACFAIPAISPADELGFKIIGSWGGTEAEISESQAGLKLCDTDQTGAIEVFNALLQSKPENRVARLNRDELLINVGAADLAERDFLYIEFRDPNFPGLLEAKARLAQVRGDRAAELGAWRAIGSRPPGAAAFREMGESFRREAKLRALELEGNVESAITGRHAEIQQFARLGCEAGWDDVADLYVGQGRFHEAAVAYAQELKLDRTRTSSRYTVIFDLSRLAIVEWAMGEKESALRDTREAIRLAGERNIQVPIDLLAENALRADLLVESTHGSDADRRAAHETLVAIAKFCSPRHPGGISSGVPAALDPKLRAGEVRRLTGVLRQAPDLEWALWDAVFLAKADPALAGSLIKLLPKESVQARVAAE